MNKLLFIIITVFIVIPPKYGYLVVIDNKKDIETFKTESLKNVYVAFKHATNLKLDTTHIFDNDKVFFEYRNKDVTFYVEKKYIVKRKNGKTIYKKIKKRM